MTNKILPKLVVKFPKTGKRMKKQLMTILFLTLFSVLTFAQQPEIDIEHFGYGETSQEAHFTIHNTGETSITNITILVDGEEYRTIRTLLTPNQGLETILYLDPGEHIIEVRSSEGAYDSLEMGISPITEKTPEPQEETQPFLEKNEMWVIGLVVIIFFIIVWMTVKRPKLDLLK